MWNAFHRSWMILGLCATAQVGSTAYADCRSILSSALVQRIGHSIESAVVREAILFSLKENQIFVVSPFSAGSLSARMCTRIGTEVKGACGTHFSTDRVKGIVSVFVREYEGRKDLVLDFQDLGLVENEAEFQFSEFSSGLSLTFSKVILGAVEGLETARQELDTPVDRIVVKTMFSNPKLLTLLARLGFQSSGLIYYPVVEGGPMMPVYRMKLILPTTENE